jgi:hypothetical protein
MTNHNNLAGWTVLVLGLLACLPGTAEAGYSSMYRGSGYYYRNYTYYSRKYSRYLYHMAVYYPSRPRYVYYYNPYTRKYWGRYDRSTGRYSLLADCNKRERLSDIPESAFPPGGAMPPAEPGLGTPMPPPPEAGLSGGGALPSAPGSGGCHAR